MSWATVRYQCPNCREVTEIPDVPEALIKGDVGDIDRICPTCGVDLEVIEIKWDQNDKDLADLDWVTITVTCRTAPRRRPRSRQRRPGTS
jgi:hypothetical protein